MWIRIAWRLLVVPTAEFKLCSAAEKGAGYKAAVAISPGSESWDSNKYLQQALTNAVSSINIPVFLIHPEKDTSVAPGLCACPGIPEARKSI